MIGIQIARNVSVNCCNFNLGVHVNDKFFFRLRDNNEEIVCTSLFYDTESSMISDIAGIVVNSRLAALEDQLYV